MTTSATAPITVPAPDELKSQTRHIAGYVYFTFICYVSIGLPLAVLPPFVHLRMGYSAVLAGLAISIQYIATLASRPWAGRISDHMGAKVSVLWGMACCTASGALLVAAAALADVHWLSFTVLIASRLVLGVGESLGSTGATLWGITAAGQEHTAKVIGMNGISTYGGMALAAPLGVVLDQYWGLASIGMLTILIGAVSFVIAWHKDPVPVEPGEHLPFRARAGPRGSAWHGAGAGRRQLQRSGHLRHALLPSAPLERRGALPHRLRRRLRLRARLFRQDHQPLRRLSRGHRLAFD